MTMRRGRALRRRSCVATLAAAAVGATIALGAVSATPAAQASEEHTPKAQQSRIVKVTKNAARSPFTKSPESVTPRPWAAPANGQAFAPVDGSEVRAGGYRVRVTPADAAAGTSRKAITGDAGGVGVRIERGRDGAVIVALTRSDTTRPGTGSAQGDAAPWRGRVSLRTTDLVSPGSADAVSRLMVVDRESALPVPVSHGTGKDTGVVSFEAAQATTYAVAAGANGSTGSFGATGLSPASTWGVSEQSGSFTWSHGFRTPPSAGGLGPSLNLSYDSGSVDGRVASTNNQPSWVGEGFELAAGGFIAREFLSCSDDMTGGSNASRKTSDLCWGKENATLLLNGKATRLIKDTATGVWRLKSDDGSTLSRNAGGGSGINSGDHWILTDSAGTKFYFGLEKRHATDPSLRNARLMVPVNGNHSGEPCYNASFAAGFCDQTWRWNLSYVEDLRGNTISYTYVKEGNRYGQNLDTKSVPYDRGGYLTRIDYGQVKGGETDVNAQQRVSFDVAERCLPSGTITCAESQLTSANAAYWPDVPHDQICTATTTCGAGKAAPAFFTRKRLVAIRTQVMKSGALTDVGRWDMAQSFPASGDGTAASLQLDTIAHTGTVGGSQPMPPIVFGRTQLANRIDSGANDGDQPLIKWRVNQVKTEAGGVMTVNYRAAECAASTLPTAADNNGKRCYPNYWTPPGALTPVKGWFHKYVVDSLVEDGAIAPSKAKVTRYVYNGSPAWHYDDAVIQPSKYRTWSEFRGYESVDTYNGDATETSPTHTRTLFYRGMDGDNKADGTKKSVVVTDSAGGTQADADWFAGMAREARTYNGAAEVDGEIRTPWTSAVRATDAWGTARIVRGDALIRSRTAREGATPFVTETATTYNSLGAATQVADKGDVSIATDDRCQTTTYVSNMAKNLLSLVATAKAVQVACGVTSATGDIVAESHTFYDGATATTTTPTVGAVSKTMVRSDSGMVTSSAATYDARGRPLTSTDALGAVTQTAYTPADHQPTTSTTVTDPLGHVTVTQVDPALGAVTKVTDPNGRATTVKYDPLGRLTQVWLPNRSTALSPSMQYSYQLVQSGPSSVTSSTLHYMGSARITSTAVVDGLLRPIQTQAQSGSGNRVITETVYDTRGLAIAQRGPWVSAGLPSGDAVTAPDASIDSIVKTTFDGAARATRAQTFVLGVEKLRTDTVYRGDAVDTLPPAGGVATRSVLDARGRQTQLWQYHGSTITSAKDVTTYGFDGKDRLISVKNQAGMTWTYGYNQLGQQTSSSDPDKGSVSTTYDLVGNVLSTTDARGQVITRTYDKVSRPLSVMSGTQKLNSWTYDTVTNGKGHLASASSWVGADEYKETVTAYNSVYGVTGNSVTIPASETGLAGTYAYTRGFNVDGSLGYVNMPAVANMPAEQYSYQRDASNLAINLTGRTAIVASSARDGFGRLTQYNLQALDTGTMVSAIYETGLGRLANYRVDRDNVGAPVVNATFAYNPAGNITSIADVPDAANPARTDRQCFSYDWAGNLTEAWANGATACASTPSHVNSGAAPYWTSWTYDSAHRRAGQVQHSAGGTADTTRTYTYPAVTAVPNGTTGGPHAATSVATKVGAGAATTATIAYDQTGNTRSTPLPSGGTGTIAWDQLGRYASMTKAGVGGSTSHVYDAGGGLLIRRDPSGKKTLFLGGDTEITHTPAVGTTPASTTAKRVFTFEGMIVAFRDGPNPEDVTFQPPGYQGSALVQVDGAGGSYAVRRFDPFGAPRGATSGAPFETQHGFLGGTGATTDATSGLVHLGAREYDPTLGRFLSVDPIMDLTDPQQWNAYGYANNNPITRSDPTGLLPEGPGAGTVFTGDGTRPSDIIVTNQSQANSSAPGGGNGAHHGNGGNSNTGGHGGQNNPNLGGSSSKATANDRAAYERIRQRQAAERASIRAAAHSAQANGMRFMAGFLNAHMTSQYFYLELLGLLPTDEIDARYGGNGWFSAGALGYEAASIAVSAGTASAVSGGRATITMSRLATEAKAAKTADEGVDLFRHVSPGELSDIQKSGVFRSGSGSMEGKWFAESGEHAQQWGNVLNGGSGSVVTTRVPSSVADKMMRMDKLDGIGPARYADNLLELNSTMNGIRLWP